MNKLKTIQESLKKLKRSRVQMRITKLLEKDSLHPHTKMNLGLGRISIENEIERLEGDILLLLEEKESQQVITRV